MRRMLAGVVLCFFVSVPPAHAELIDFGGGLLYDAVQDLTWLDPFYAQPPHTLMFGDPAVGGCSQEACDWHYTWRGATAWVGGLSYEGYNDWRLPDKFMPGAFGGDNEFHRMLEQLRGWEFGLSTFGDEPELVTAGEQGPFLSPLDYWFVWMDEPFTWTSPFAGNGYDFPDRQDGTAGGRTRIMPVRSGVPFSQVPEPATLGLVGIGVLIGIARMGRRRANNI